VIIGLVDCQFTNDALSPFVQGSVRHSFYRASSGPFLDLFGVILSYSISYLCHVEHIRDIFSFSGKFRLDNVLLIGRQLQIQSLVLVGGTSAHTKYQQAASSIHPSTYSGIKVKPSKNAPEASIKHEHPFIRML
jgi:hypothetical protein